MKNRLHSRHLLFNIYNWRLNLLRHEMKIINWLHTDIYYAVIGGEAVETKPANMKGVDWKTKEIYKLKEDWWCTDLLGEAFS